ncbi:VWD domain-containing protein, partial [Rhabdobacter roseus]
MKRLLLFIFFLTVFSLNSCKDKSKVENPAPEERETIFDKLNHWELKSGQTKAGMVIQDFSENEIVMAYGRKATDGSLITVDSIFLHNRTLKASFCIKINSKGLVTDLIARSEGALRKLSFSDYNLTSGTLAVEAVDMLTNQSAGPKQTVKISDDMLLLIKTLSQNGTSNGRISSLRCTWKEVVAWVKFTVCIASTITLFATICSLEFLVPLLGAALGPVCTIVATATIILVCSENADQIVETIYNCDRDPNEPVPPLPLPPLPFCLQIAADAENFDEWDAECKDNPDDEEDPAESWGDPHLITFDGLKYDFQAWGEFVAAKSLTDNFEVQVRYIGSNGGVFSFNNGIAIQTGGDVISNTNAGLFINGTRQNSNFTTISLQGGGTISYEDSRYGRGVKVVSKWGDIVRMHGNHPRITLNKSRKGKIVGLFGNYDGNPKNDLLLKDNKIIDISDLKEDNFSLRLPFERIYPVLPEAWRVTQSSSLFHYQAGESTAIYTVLDYPKSIPTFTTERREWARKACMDGGVTKEPYLSACIFDVAVTGSLDWIEESLTTQNQSQRTNLLQLNTDGAPSNDEPVGAVALMVNPDKNCSTSTPGSTIGATQ